MISELTRFVRDCLDEDERDARLFHELTCPAESRRPGTASGPVVPLPGPGPYPRPGAGDPGHHRRLRAAAPRAGQRMPGMLSAAAGVRQVLGAVAAGYELSPRWQEQWRP